MYYIRIEEVDEETENKKIIEHAMINPKIIGKSEQIVCREKDQCCLSIRYNQEGFFPCIFYIIVEGYDYLKQRQAIITTPCFGAIFFNIN